jgi:anthraniloyl-CoA monooxygenase
MRIVCIGGGPAGLYFAILMKLQDRAHQITVYERNRPDDTFGWGVVFSDETLENLARADRTSAEDIHRSFAHWDDIDVHFRGRVIRSSGHGFSGIERKQLLGILQERARGLGVDLVYETSVDDLAPHLDADLVIAADGINSRIRETYRDHFSPDIDVRANKFIWLGTHRLFDAFTFIFKETQWGWFQVHAYKFNRDTSTFIVETTDATWEAAGLADMEAEEGIRFCEDLFAEHLDGNPLMSNARHLRGSSVWINFPRILNATWVKDNIVLMGDAAHTAHFSIGSGTKLAFEDAISLAAHLRNPQGSIAETLHAYQEERKVGVFRIQSAARNSTEWFEHVARYAEMAPEQFAYSLLTRSQRVSHENLRLRDPAYLESVERWFAEQATGTPQNRPVPPMFTPFRLRGMELHNRVVVSPMATYSAEEGLPNDFHLVHLGEFALGGAGLVFTEMTCVSPQARITPGCPGMWCAEHAAAWRRITAFVHKHSRARICLQLGHAGRKGSTRVGWEGMDEPLDDGNWPLVAASPIPWAPANQVPRAASRADMDAILADYVTAAEFGVEADFDMLELHMAHGYLLASFISPLTNRRTDAYGGSLEARMKFPLEVIDAVREVWPDDRPMSVRISASDWQPDGLTPQDSVAIAHMLKGHGVDLVDVSAGQTSPDAKPVYGRMFQTPFADRIRNEAKIATMAVGNIFEPDHVNSILAAGRADLVALARAHLANPRWTQHAAACLGHSEFPWPPQYLAGRDQFLRNLERADEMAVKV